MKLSIVLSLCGSLALGGAALVVARVWLPSGTPKAHASTEADMHLMPMVVATGPLPYGTRLEASKLSLIKAPASMIPAGAFTSIDQVMTTDHGGAPLVLTAMAAREPVLPAKVTGPGARPSVAVQISEGMRGYAIPVTDASGVGGNALPGDWVDVILTRQTNPDRPDKGLISEVVVQNVRVLGLDLNADPTSTQTAVRHTATLEVKPEDAQKVALAHELGDLSLALRRTGAAEETATRMLHAADVGSKILSAPGAARTITVRKPAAPAIAALPPLMPPPLPPQHTITIINGGAASRISVPVDHAATGAAG